MTGVQTCALPICLAEREVSEDELIDLMVQEPTLLRRPIVLIDNQVVIGSDRKRLAAALHGASRKP